MANIIWVCLIVVLCKIIDINSAPNNGNSTIEEHKVEATIAPFVQNSTEMKISSLSLLLEHKNVTTDTPLILENGSTDTSNFTRTQSSQTVQAEVGHELILGSSLINSSSEVSINSTTDSTVRQNQTMIDGDPLEPIILKPSQLYSPKSGIIPALRIYQKYFTPSITPKPPQGSLKSNIESASEPPCVIAIPEDDDSIVLHGMELRKRRKNAWRVVQILDRKESLVAEQRKLARDLQKGSAFWSWLGISVLPENKYASLLPIPQYRQAIQNPTMQTNFQPQKKICKYEAPEQVQSAGSFRVLHTINQKE